MSYQCCTNSGTPETDQITYGFTMQGGSLGPNGFVWVEYQRI
jgi:hypothetical protein